MTTKKTKTALNHDDIADGRIVSAISSQSDVPNCRSWNMR